MNYVVFMVIVLLQLCQGQTINYRQVEMEVANGRMEYLTISLLNLNVRSGAHCKVEVVNNEPMYQRVGKVIPEIFDCDFLEKTVRYEHNGSPFLSQDVVKLKVYTLLENETTQEIVYLYVNILNSRCDIIQINKVALVVPYSSEFSNPITKDVMDFTYDRNFDLSCEVRIPQHNDYTFPQFGRLVIQRNKTSLSDPEMGNLYKEFGSISMSCNEFLMLRLRYQHLSTPTPNIDYIPIHVIITDRRSGSIVQQERHWLPVTILTAYPNQPPKGSFGNMLIVEVDQFALTNILPMVVSAMDGETHNERLVFNITSQPSQGFITNLNDESIPIDSFRQQDLEELQIAYQPPNISFSDRQTFSAEFIVFDDYFQQSEPIRILISIRVSDTNAPRVSWNMGLTMLEGQSRYIDQNCLQVVDRDNLNQVRFTLAGGLRHGRLFINTRPVFTFQWADVENGVVEYQHDDTDTRSDYVILRVSDIKHSMRFKLPIRILPTDDAPPFLITNIVFLVEEGQTIMIHRFMLEASDADSNANYITFNITKPPTAGQIQKRNEWEHVGWSVNTFKQSDMYKGLISYKHSGNEIFEDSLEFVMIDACRPVPNLSAPQKVNIKITPVEDLPPQPGAGNSLTLVVNETDVVYLTSKQLDYIDMENNDATVTYIVTTPCRHVNGMPDDSGKLIFTDDMVMLMKDPMVPQLRTFTQVAVNHNKVAYMPPIHDVGLYPLDVEFIFEVTDSGDRSVKGKRFAITILPVNNIAPRIKTENLTVNEGNTQNIDLNTITISDTDTFAFNLQIKLIKLPLVGIIKKDNVAMEVDDTFTQQDLAQLRISYSHSGSEAFQDYIILAVTDGIQNSSSILNININPIDDMLPVVEYGENVLKVNEGDSVVITSSFLSANDQDTNNHELVFEVLSLPQHGSIQLIGNVVTSFLQGDIINGNVLYVHDGGEIGMQPINDSATFVVSDMRGRSELLDEQTKELVFAIFPVNTQPPQIALGNNVFRCNEGQVKEITEHEIMATDVDSPSENITFTIIHSPAFGFIEDITPTPGYEKTIGVKSNQFDLNKLTEGYIRYVQSNHAGIEPTFDQFTVNANDGLHTSIEVSFLISIQPQNDEEPIVTLQNITCNEGSIKMLALHVEDLDVPNDHVMIRVTDPPRHGMLMDEMQMRKFKRSIDSSFSHAMHHMEAIDEFSMHDLHFNQVLPAYMHDGSESHVDGFDLKISDGKHTVNKHMTVTVMQVNDERPVVKINKGIVLEVGQTKIISNINLQTTDEDTSSQNIVYVLHSIPRRGVLQLKGADIDEGWLNLDYADTFTEHDVEMNRLRYEHQSIISYKEKDSFRFSVSDGEFISQRFNFNIHINQAKKSVIRVAVKPLYVVEGEQVFLTNNEITAVDETSSPQEIVFDVVKVPSYGHLEYISFPGFPIEMFTQLDLLARTVFYKHTSKVDAKEDTFTLLVENTRGSKEVDIVVYINNTDSIYPTLILGKDNIETGLTLYSGSSVSISSFVIKIQDEDSPKENVRLQIVELPAHGALYVRGTEVVDTSTQISEVDLENGDLFYQHGGGKGFIDRFTFTVTDSVHTGYIHKGLLVTEPTAIYLRIEEFDNAAPVLILNTIPSTIQKLTNGKMPNYGIYIDQHSLIAKDIQSPESNSISFTVTEPPSYGILKHINEEEAISRFTQEDINKRKVFYEVSSRLNVTADSFYFDVEDSWGNTLQRNIFNLTWTRIAMSVKKIKTCEDIGSVLIKVIRHGDVKSSSFVGVHVKPGSAKQGSDFIPSTAEQIQFDPGVSSQQWALTIVNDSLHENKERLKIKLVNPINTVLSPSKKLITVIIKDGSCTNSGSSLGRKNKKKVKKGRKAKKKKNKRKGKQRKNIAKDSPPSDTVSTVKYGKLGRGKVVAPSSYFRNGSVRIWTYHGINTVTVDETDVSDLPSLQSSTLRTSLPDLNQRMPGIDLPKSTNNPFQINDDPYVLVERNEKFRARIEVQNSNQSAVISVSGNAQNPENNETGLTSSNAIPKKCKLATSGQLFFNSVSRVLYQCNGAQWIPWKKTQSKPQSVSPKIETKSCEDGWKGFHNRCYFVSGISHGDSWNAAQRKCTELHSAQLVSIENRKQMNWLWKVARRTPFYMGLNNKLDPSTWEWMDGSDTGFTNWKSHFPTSNQAHNCAVTSSKKRWINTRCSLAPINLNLKYICVKNIL